MTNYDSAPFPPGTFELDPEILWVQHCAEGPVPVATARAVEAVLVKELRPWLVEPEVDFAGPPDRARAEAARLLGARCEDISLSPTTSAGLVAVAQGMDWRARDEVLLPLGEFPANLWPWKALTARGVELREVPLWEEHRAGVEAYSTRPPSPDVAPEDRLIQAIGPRTRLMAVSWVRFQDGLKLDLPRLAAGCRERGIPLVVDGIQGAGTMPVSLAGLSAFASGGHKGLLAPQGLGLLWTESEFRQGLMPCGSWLSVEQAFDFDRPCTDHDRAWLPTGVRLEAGVPNLMGSAALAASLATINRAGVRAVFRHVRRLQRLLLEGLLREAAWTDEAGRLLALLERDRLGPFLAFHHGGRGSEGLEELLQQGLRQGIRATRREGYLRIAFHGWHSEEDAERLRRWLVGS